MILNEFKLTLVLFSERDGYWKVADFGITSEGTARRTLMTNFARGTTCYRAPVGNDPTFNNKVDIWAFGCIMFEMCTVKTAFLNDVAVYEFRASGRKPNMFGTGSSSLDPGINDLARKIEAWTMAILTIDPAERPSADELADDIAERINRTTIALTGVRN